MSISIKHKRGTASALTSANPTLAAGELGFETDTRRFKLGNGSTAWTSLSYVVPYVTATDRLLGRSSSGAGAAEEITCTAFGRSLIDDANAAAARTTLGAAPTASPTFTGTVTSAAANFSGTVTVTSPLILTGTVAGNVRYLEWQTSGSRRWQVSAHFNTESGSNAGSDLHVTRWSDAGAFLGTPLQIRRDNGLVTCESGLVVQTNPLRVIDGSASSPAIGFSSDTNTGIAQIGGADTLSFVTDQTERVRISATGEVLVGNATDNGAYNLQCNGTGVWGAGAYTNGSDERIKDDIAPLGEATSVIAAIQPVTFRYRKAWSADRNVQPGFVAQQLREALAGTPYLEGVVQQGPRYLSVAYQAIIPLLVKALQESNDRIAALEERLDHA